MTAGHMCKCFQKVESKSLSADEIINSCLRALTEQYRGRHKEKSVVFDGGEVRYCVLSGIKFERQKIFIERALQYLFRGIFGYPFGRSRRKCPQSIPFLFRKISFLNGEVVEHK